MDENKSYNLILSLSGYEYVAPDDGYFVLSNNAVKVGEQIKLGDNDPVVAAEENESLTAVCKALKGDKIRIEYTTTGNINFFKFIVAPAIQVMATSSSPMLTQMNANLPMDKPTKPTSNMPSSFGGIKNDFSDELKANGYEYDKPAVLGGDNLNFLIDSIGTTIQYYTAITDYFCSIDPDKTPIVDYANRLSQTEFAFHVYDENEIYSENKTVIIIDELKNASFYTSLKDENQGHPVTDTTWWRQTGFSVPLATINDFGIIKPDNSTISIANGIISAITATANKKGIVQPNSASISIDTNGVISAKTATSSAKGIVQPDNTTVSINDSGVISAKIATSSAKGIVQPDNTTISINSNGVISAKPATSSAKGIVQPDNSTITINSNGILSIIQSAITNIAFPIGMPILSLDSKLGTNEIWLEGASVSKTTYAKLFAIYGTTYGASTDTNFTLPDFRNRALWGADTFGYLSAGLPNITGYFSSLVQYDINGCFTTGSRVGSNSTSGGSAFIVNFDASLSSPIYSNDIDTVQPPAIKIRVKTRYI